MSSAAPVVDYRRFDEEVGVPSGPAGVTSGPTDSFPVVATTAVPWIDRDQMIEVDRIMIDELGIDLVRMMEGAGRTLAAVAERRFQPTRVAVVAGRGGNGGGGLTAARHLANHGIGVDLVLSVDPEELSVVAGQQFEIDRRLGIDVVESIPPRVELVIDALVGYSLTGAPRGRTADLVVEINRHPSPVLALDVPTGLDVNTGFAHDPAVQATATMTLAGPKVGLRDHPLVGELYLADISVPPTLFNRVGQGPGPVFDRGPILGLVG